MKIFKIPVTYKSWGLIEVEAETLADAYKYAEENINDLPLPQEPEYIDDSYEIEKGDMLLVR